MIQELLRESTGPHSVMQGDKLIVTIYEDDIPVKKVTHKITETMNIDEILIFGCSNEFGFSQGLGCIVGKAKA